MKKFTVKKSSAGPCLYFGSILIKSWLGCCNDKEADELCCELNKHQFIICECGLEIHDDNIEYSNRENEEGEAYYEIIATCSCGNDYECGDWGECEDFSECKSDLQKYINQS